MTEVSVIVPFYNVQDYIKECLSSLANQTYTDIEILCIDDASPDESIKIANSFADNDKRIRIIRHSKNKGLGGARNTGIDHATGKYICFVDSDDYISPNFIELLHHNITITNSDIAICSIFKVENNIESPFYKKFENRVIHINKHNALEAALDINPACWNKMFRLILLKANNIKQPEQRYYEDVTFWTKAVFCSRKISTISERLYFYRQRSGSIMKSITKKHIDDRINYIKDIDNYIKSEIIPVLGSSTSNFINQAALYLANHISYGNTLIEESEVSHRTDLSDYYNNKVANFCRTHNWEALELASKLYANNQGLKQENLRLNKLLETQKKEQTDSANNITNLEKKHNKQTYALTLSFIFITLIILYFTKS